MLLKKYLLRIKHIPLLFQDPKNLKVTVKGTVESQDVYNCHVLEDVGYDSHPHRIKLRANNNIPVILGRKNRKEIIEYDKPLYRLRRGIEIYFGKLKENRRIATRYEKSDGVFLNFIILAAIKMIIC